MMAGSGGCPRSVEPAAQQKPMCERRYCNAKGQGLAEYIIVVVIVAIIIIVAIRFFGGTVTNQFEDASDQVGSLSDGVGAAGRAGEGEAKPATGGTYGRSVERSQVDLKDAERAAGAGGESAGGGAGGNAEESGGGGSEGLGALKAEGVGGAGDKKPVEDIELDWGTLGFIALVFCVFGGAIVMRSNEKDKGKKKKKKKGKKK